MRPQIIFSSENANPIISIILLDWSCRESFHSLEYLNNQSIPRDQYEILWIEYYNSVAPRIREGIEKSTVSERSPLVDQWIIMNMPKNIYYHKHLMYNIGILASNGRIICICDSDAIFSPTFVLNILQTFATDNDAVVHFDEIRNHDPRFYPFNYPSIEEILGNGCINWENGHPKRILDFTDTLHSRNYGACMCALRESLIAIGGADEHKDFLGHICGPYDMTFRLINAGKKEIWHEYEYIYHVWHPGNEGIGNYSGPHDGQRMSLPAIKARETGRILPFDENPAIRSLRLRLQNNSGRREEVLSYAIQEEKIKDWIIS